MSLWLISFVLWIPGITLSILECFARPRLFMCSCRTGWMANRHFKPRWLFFIGAVYIVSDAVAAAAGDKTPIVAAVGAYYLWRWWKHTKNSRKKLKDRALGVVRKTSAGLKVVPVSGGAS